MKQGQSIRAVGGALRIEYDPAWSPTKPFKLVVNGIALIRVERLASALRWMDNKVIEWGWREPTPLKWTEWS